MELIPVGRGAESLKRIVLIDTHVLILGRNEASGLSTSTDPKCVNISRNHIEIFLDQDIYKIKATAKEKGVVHLNGKPLTNEDEPKPLNVNDVISLLGASKHCNWLAQSYVAADGRLAAVAAADGRSAAVAATTSSSSGINIPLNYAMSPSDLMPMYLSCSSSRDVIVCCGGGTSRRQQ